MASYLPVTTYRPTESSSGLVTGYTNRDYLNSPAKKDYPALQVGTNLYVSALTGKPWSGTIPNPAMGGTPIGFANRGQLVPNVNPVTGLPVVASSVDPMKPTLTNAVKQPNIINANNDLLAKQSALSTTLGKSFDQYLKEASELNAQNRLQLSADQKATDISQISKDLPEADRANAAAQREISADIGRANSNYADATADRLARLTEENRRYETAAQAVAGQAFDEAKKQTALYHLSTGTPTSGSGDLSNRYINAYARINVPLQQQLSGRRYNQINNIEGAATRELYGNDLAFAASKSALESDLSNRSISTLKYLQGLRMQVAGMSRSMAADYLRQLGVPFELGQRIISGDIANLSGIQGIDERANFYGLTQPYDASREAAVITPGIRSPSRNYVPQSPDYRPRVTGSIGTVTGNQFATGASSRPTRLQYVSQAPQDVLARSEDRWYSDQLRDIPSDSEQWVRNYLP